MDMFAVVCFGLLIGSAVAEPFRTAVATPMSTNNQMVRFSKDLQCESGANIYVTFVQYSYTTRSCLCQSGQQICPFGVESSDLNSIGSSCWTSSSCTLTFSAPPKTCPEVTATITYMCAPANPVLTINRQSSDTGSSLTAGYSATSGLGALWVCSVEAWDCSSVDVTLTLFIRNGNDTVSYFSVAADRLGVAGVTTFERTLQTPFNVALNDVPGSDLLNALLTMQAGENLTVTCGRSNDTPPTAFCNVPIVSTPPSRKFGQALTAVHSSSGVETDNSTWGCVVETGDCSTGAPVDVSVFISNRGGTPASFFSLDGQRVNANHTASLTTPAFVTLHLVNGSRVDPFFVHVKAKENITMSCGWQGNTPPVLFCKQPMQTTSRRFGRTLTAGYSSTGVETGNSTLGCVVETADCSENASVIVSVLIRHRGNASDLVFSNEQRLNGSYIDLYTPFPVILDLRNGSEVDNAYVSIKAMVNVSMTCGNITTNSGGQTESSLYHCPSNQSPDGNSNNGAPADGNNNPANSAVGPAVGGAIGGLVVIATVSGAVIFVKRNRKKDQESPPTSKTFDDNVHVNSGYDDVSVTDNHLNILPADSANYPKADAAGPSDYDVLGQRKLPADAQSGGNIYARPAPPLQGDVKTEDSHA